jgi:PAS domain S-box-containing protein
MGRDITERKQVEDALRESEAKYKYLVETSQNLIWECNAEGRFTYLNPEWESVLGYKLDEMLGRSFGEFQPPEISARDLKEFSRHLAGGAVKGYETVYIASSGELKNLLFNAIPMFDHEGNIAGTQGTATDITKLKQGEIELKNTANQLRTNIDRMPIGYILWDENFKALEWNQAAEKIFGYTKKEMIGKRPVEFIVLKEVRPFVNEVIKRLLSGEDKVSYSEDGNNITKDGRIISCMWHNATFVDTDGNTTAVLSMVQDITERKKEQDNLSQSLKDKEILLREVHHRVKNNLSVIMALLQLQANNADDNKIISMLEDTRSRIMSMSLVHEKLYQSEGISTIDLDDYISTLISRIFVSLGISQEKIKYDLSISRIDLNLDVLIPLGMILNELITNSIKHAFKGDSGSISISLSASGEQKTLTYYDSGVGLPESFEINKITTLGLKIVSTLTKQLKGELDITSAPGARFTIKFIKE